MNTNVWRLCRIVFNLPTRAIAFCLGFLVLLTVPMAYGAVIDQSNGPPFQSQVNPINNAQIGQEFTPTLTGVDFVNLGIHSIIGNTESVTVDIRLANANHTFTPLNPVLGTATIGVPASYDASVSGLLAFNLGATTPLTPGTLYVIQILDNGPNPGGVFVFSNGNAYAGGEAIVNGADFGGLKMVFQEGVNTVTPEPSSVALLSCGVIGLLGYAWRRRRALTRCCVFAARPK